MRSRLRRRPICGGCRTVIRVSSKKDELCASMIALSSRVLWIVILSLSTMSRSGSGLLRHGHDEPAQLGRSLSRKRRVGSCASRLSPCKHSKRSPDQAQQNLRYGLATHSLTNLCLLRNPSFCSFACLLQSAVFSFSAAFSAADIFAASAGVGTNAAPPTSAVAITAVDNAVTKRDTIRPPLKVSLLAMIWLAGSS